MTENLSSLFVELVKIQLKLYPKVSKNILANTILHYAQMTPFNLTPIEKWHSICAINGIKYDI